MNNRPEGEPLAAKESSGPIVIIGASAGGVEALSRLVQDLPADFPAPVLVAQHSDPERPSQLTELLGYHTSMEVRQIEDHADLEHGVIYVVPANRVVEFADFDVSVRPDGIDRPTPSIDRLLESAARAHGEQVIAVILSGSGSDGTAGAHLVKEEHGTVIIQDPSTAEYPSMPRSLAPTSVDFVRDLAQIGDLLVELVNRPEALAEAGAQLDGDGLDSFLTHLRSESSIEFSQYKTPTIIRRLQRRLVTTNCNTLDEYRSYLDQNHDEYYNLVDSFLIKVTEFFRDKELFEHLQATVIPELIEHGRKRGNQLRVWSAGSATGEEAYSVAILVAEALGEEIDSFTVRIFATDIDDAAVTFARRGVYSSATLKQMPEHLKNRYFTSKDGEYEISKQVRSMVVFGQHDLAQRSPFPSIDLILCRNVLIYFTGDLQRRALQLFAYSLRESGYLVLGKSESTRPLGDYFTAEDSRLKIYRRYGKPAPIPVGPVDTSLFSVPRAQTALSWYGQAPLHAHRMRRDPVRSRTSGERSEGVLFHLPVGVVVVDRSYDVRALNNMARHYLGIYGPAVGEDLLHLIRTIPLESVRDSIDRAFRRNDLVKVEDEWEVETANGDKLFIEIACQRQKGDDAGQSGQNVVVVLTDITNAVGERRRVAQELDSERAENQQQSDRVDQLLRINQQLVESNRELAEANEELRTTNEHLMVSNEEAQTTAEEIETLNEELQTTNEELETLNEELQATVEELNATNEEMRAQALELHDERMMSEAERSRLQTVLVSMGDGVLLVDLHGEIMLMNEACREMFGEDLSSLRPENDSGDALASDEGPLYRAAHEGSFTMQFSVQVSEKERRWFEASGRPLREEADGRRASVVVFRDISERSLRLLQEEFMSVAGHELRTPLTALQGYLEMLQQHLSNGDERSQRYVNISLEMVRRLVRLISDLLDVGRLQSGKFDLLLEEIDIKELLAGTVEIGQALSSTHTLELHVPEETVTAVVDPMRVQQVLLNLLANAISYSPGKDTIDVCARLEDDEVVLEVQDYGVGVSDDAQARIFNRFFQGARVSHGAHRGLGLGLFITKEIVDAHGGRIELDSKVGEGATFRVYLPLEPGASGSG